MEWEPQYPNAPSNPTSLPSQSAGTRSEKVPTLKQISPSSAVSALSKLTDDELRRKGVEDLLRILRRVEADYKSLLGEHGSVVKDVNRRLQIYVLETRSLKEVNQKLQDDNQELRDLCCFLDDDRQRGRKLAREWQRFGRYTASVMRSEVAVYQEKLHELEDKQNELITENMELKELCLFLDQERVRMNGDRDEGDGSSNGTVTGHEDGIVSMETVNLTAPNSNVPTTDSYPVSPSSAASYIKELELKVCLLEQEKKLLAQKVDRNSADGLDIVSSIFDKRSGDASHMMSLGKDQSVHGLKPGTALLRKSPVSSKPETVMHAMKVLQVHEELEKTPTEDESLDDPEKAIVREMCNVVWRTLGDVGDIGSFNESSDSIHEPPFLTDSAGRPNFPQDIDPPFDQGHTFSMQPQSLITSTPVPAGLKQSNVGNQFFSGPSENYMGSTYHLQPHKINSSKPSHESKQQQSSQSHYTQGQNEPGIRNRQNSISERLATDRIRNVPNKQSIDRPDDRRNPEQKHSYYTPDTSSKSSNQQQLANHPPPQQPPVLSLHHQQHSLPDMSSNPYSQQRPTDLTVKSVQQPSQYQQPPPSTHQLQQRLPEKSTLSHPQKSADLISRSHDQSHRYQQRPSPPQLSSSLLGNQNQRSIDPQPNKQLSGNNYPQHNDLTNTNNLPGNPLQHQRNTQSRPHQQVKLLDAPGSQRNFQRPVPAQGQEQSNDRLHEESQGQKRLHSRDNDNSTERDTQTYPAPRSVSTSSSSSIMHPHNSQITPHNMQSGKSTQNVKGPSVFRAYPPQLTSMPTQPVSMRISPGQDLSSGGNPPHADPSRGGYSLESQQQSKGSLTNKRFQEQEWRQNFLDDSDTL